MLISEEPVASKQISNEEAPGPLPDSIVAHLDNSHITVHTYPESHPVNGISTFRADIDVSTCGRISPLQALNFLIHCFDSDIVIMDYRVRGFTRDVRGKKHYIDHEINSIQNFIAKDTKELYQMIDVNVYQENIFHTKMMLKELDMDSYLFGIDATDMKPAKQKKFINSWKKKCWKFFMAEIFLNSAISLEALIKSSFDIPPPMPSP